MKQNITDYISQFENILNFSDFSWWIIDYKNDPGYFYCNDLMVETFLLDKDEKKHSVADTCPIAGDYIKNVKLASTKQANLIIREYLELLNQEKKEYNNNFPYFDIRTNTIKYFSSRAKALELDEDGNVSVLYGIIENITDREIQAKELAEYHNIIDKHVITSSTNIEGDIVSISEAFCDITGYTKEELIGQKHTFLRHPKAKDKIDRSMWENILAGKVWEGEFKSQKKNGNSFWIKSVISPTFDEEGKIKGYTTINQDITDKKTIEKLSNKDKLTNAYNRGKLDNLLEREHKRALRYGTDFSIIMLDIDHFKLINDTYGHLVGDQILIQIAQILNSYTRTTDFIGRWGGEEFLIICPNSDIIQTQKVAIKLKKQFEESRFEIDKQITSSFGVTAYRKDDTIDDMLKRADRALYTSKHNGRNRVELEY